MFACAILLPWLITASALADPSAVGVIRTIAGDGTAGYLGDGAAGTAARVNAPYGVAVDSVGNAYIADTYNHRIRMVTPAGVITTVAGNGTAGFLGDGALATSARLYYPTGVALDTAGNLYIADKNNHRIRKVTAATGVISTVAGSGAGGFGGDAGLATAAQLNFPFSIAVDSSGNLYIGDQYNHRVRKVTAATGVITTLAGTGTLGYDGDGALATAALLNYPAGVGVDGAGNVYIGDEGNNRIRKVAVGTGVITTVVGTGTAGFLGEAGPATAARLSDPLGLAVDAFGNVYIADHLNSRIRRLTVATGILTTVAGDGAEAFGGDLGLATAAPVNRPIGVAVDGAGSLYIADTVNNRVRKVGFPSATRSMLTLAGTGVFGYDGDGAAATAALLNQPLGVAVDASGNTYIGDTGNHRIRKVSPAGVITTVAGTGVAGFSGENGPATAAQIYSPIAMAVDAAGNFFFADYLNNRIRKVTVATGVITTVAGSGTPGFSGDGLAATAAQLYRPQGVAIDAAGNIYIADTTNNRIRKVTAATGVITTIAGSGTAGYLGDGAAATAAQINQPTGVAVDSAENVFIADRSNHRIRKVAAGTAVITTVAGNGIAGFDGENGTATAGRLYYPSGVAVDLVGNVYIGDQYNHRIRKLTVSSGVLTTVAGSAEAMFGGDGGAATAAQLQFPFGVAVDGTGNLFIADANNTRIREAPIPSAVTPPTTTTVGATNVTAGTATLNGTVNPNGSNSIAMFEYGLTTSYGTQAPVYTQTGSGMSPVGVNVSIGGLACNTPYHFRAVGTNAGGSTTGVDMFFSTATCPPPPNVMTLAPTNITQNTATLNASVNPNGINTTAVFQYGLTTSYGGLTGVLNAGAGSSPVPLSAGIAGLSCNSSYHVRATANSSAGPTNGNDLTFMTAGCPVVSRADFNGDGFADILFRNASGAITIYFMNGTTIIGGGPGPTVDPLWVIAGTGDYNGDGKSDLLFRNTSTGALAFWFMDGTLPIGGGNIGPIDLAWQIVGSGDHNGDGKSDLLWQNTSNGQIAIWLMNGATIMGGGGVGAVDPAYRIVGSGDYNGDGKADILFRHSSGSIAMWFMNGNLTTGGAAFGVIDPAWQIVGSGDYNHDGKADFLWHHSTGAMAIWLMDGGTILSGAAGAADPSWQIFGTGDYNHDGTSDVLWRHTTGTVVIWYMNGSGAFGGGTVGTVDPSWQIVYTQ